MTKNKCLAAVRRRAGGRLIDIDDVLLALFSEPECNDRRRWPEVFGQIRAAQPKAEAGSFIARAIRDYEGRTSSEG